MKPFVFLMPLLAVLTVPVFAQGSVCRKFRNDISTAPYNPFEGDLQADLRACAAEIKARYPVAQKLLADKYDPWEDEQPLTEKLIRLALAAQFGKACERYANRDNIPAPSGEAAAIRACIFEMEAMHPAALQTLTSEHPSLRGIVPDQINRALQAETAAHAGAPEPQNQPYPGDGYPNEVGKFEQYKALRGQVSNNPPRAAALERWVSAFRSYVPPSGPDDIDTMKSNVRRWRELKATEWALDHETPDDAAPVAVEPPRAAVSASPDEPAPVRRLPPSSPVPPETKTSPGGTVVTGVSNIIKLLLVVAALILLFNVALVLSKPFKIIWPHLVLAQIGVLYKTMPRHSAPRILLTRWLVRLLPGHLREAAAAKYIGAA